MRLIFPVLCLTSLLAVAGEMKFGVNTNQVSSFQDKKFTSKSLEPADLSRSGSNGGFDKKFETKSFTGFDRQANLGGRNIEAATVDFNKTFPTGSSSLADKKFTGGDQEAKQFANQPSPWSSRQTAKGFDKKIEVKEYQGREVALIKRDMEQVTQGLNSVRDLPNRALTVAEVKELLNRDRGPGKRHSETPTPKVSPPPSSATPAP